MATLYVEIANDAMSRESGLMHRAVLGKNSGMLFCFPDEQRLSFWMYNTKIPLDIAFIGEDLRIKSIASMIPFSTRSTMSPIPCKYALEANQGWFEQNGIQQGDGVGVPGGLPQPLTLTSDIISAVRMTEQSGLKAAFMFLYEYPEGTVKPYSLLPLDKYYIRPGATDGPLLSGPCRQADGQYRNFIISRIKEFKAVPMQGESAGKAVEFTPPELEGAMEENAPGVPRGAYCTQQLQVYADTFDELVKCAQAVSGDSQLMMGEYWDYLKKQRQHGLSEGEAVLRYLQENSERNRPKTKKKRRKRSKK